LFFVKTLIVSLFGIFGLGLTALGQSNVLYEINFEKAAVGSVPEDFLILDGRFAVTEENGNRFLELPGAPLDSFAAQFGPAEIDNVGVSVRIKGTAKGRRYPTFGVGLNGVAGYKLQVSPAKKILELYKDQDVKESMPYDWKSGQWTRLKLQVRKVKESAWKVECKVWAEGMPEPSEWMITTEEKETPGSGRASVFGSPFSGTPIQFDDFVVSAVQPAR
jgi:hypothetical protein